MISRGKPRSLSIPYSSDKTKEMKNLTWKSYDFLSHIVQIKRETDRERGEIFKSFYPI